MEQPPYVTHSGNYVYAHGLRRLGYAYTPHFFSWSHTPVWKLHIPARTFTFTVLRDPVARALSYYRYLRDERSDALEVFAAPNHERALAADGFQSFLDRVPEATLLNQLFMFSQEMDPNLAAQRVRSFQAWFFVESFDAGLAYLSRTLQLPLPHRKDRPSIGPTPAPGDLSILRERLAPEYEFLARLKSDPGTNFVGSFIDL